MSDSEPKKGLPTKEEFFAFAIELADLTNKALLDGQGVREEVRNTLKNFSSSNTAIVDRITKVEKSYTPAVVKNAVHDSMAVLSDLKDQIDNLFDRLTRRADRVDRGQLLKIALWTLVVAFALAAATWLALQAVPTLTEIADRRATLKVLQEQITGQNQQLEQMKGRLVFSNGRWYARTDNSPPVNLCFDPPRQEKCDGPYVAIR